MLHARNGAVDIGNTSMDYISFGKGSETLIMLPGLGDGLTTVRGKALALAFAYRVYARQYKVYVFSRKKRLEEACTTRTMARDQAEAMRALGISGAHLIGVSQGGMIAQYLAMDAPELVQRLVLAVTLSKGNETLDNAVGHWMELAERGDYKGIMVDTAEKSYSERYLRRYRFLYSLLGIIGKPKGFSRFMLQARSCLQHNAYEELHRITCPTLIIGGGCDRIVGPSSAAEMAQRIAGSELYVCEGLGHAAYEEAKDFNARVLAFLGR